ncbi:50S ribosomal protein L1 [Fimbriimonas ginsengisoli]|uniref:Large ribosomal subunit protein uL1 n=1 Tax=Fimbriimonas ginsengisoli Gsoil 348 TaxID=661478 RepID=A0A068NQN7_FIMGI|nr:50S ribosomal protein L1 [Fimbriimonas ginsengisoli]AIE85873.1 50S ribosomal protein L1 [Fimbriimonas ginsengisoli Gsoil 348]
MRKNIRKAPHSPRFEAIAKTVDKDVTLDIVPALAKVKETATAKFVESVDLAVKLGIDPRKGDQNVRGITNLPHGTGKIRKVAVLARGDLAAAAEEAGADTVGGDELIAQIQGGFRDFDVLLATEEMAPQIGKVGRLLGPRTPNKRNGTVTNNIAAAVREIKGATRVEYRADKAGVVHLGIGKVNFTDEQLLENFRVGLNALLKAKPAGAKGRYIRSITVSASMGPGIPVDIALASKYAA